MGRLIDTSELAKHIALQKKRFGNLLEVPICNVFADMIRDTPTAKAIPKADYETRLKDDLVAIFTDLLLEIHELENPYPHDYDNLLPLAQHNAFYDAKSTIEDLVEQKIDKLKENTDG